MSLGERLHDAPPSAKLVYRELELAAGGGDGSLTQRQVARRTRLSLRTTRHALSILSDNGLVEEGVYIPDARQSLYTPVDVAEEDDIHPQVGAAAPEA